MHRKYREPVHRPPSGEDPISILTPRSLLAQVLAVNGLLIGATAVIVLVALDGRAADAGILVGALVATMAGTGLLLRRRFLPLDELVTAMEQTDLARPEGRVPLRGGGSAEVSALSAAFSRMLARLEVERRQAGKAVVQAQERERKRIAQDLHDEVNQALTAILLRLEATGHKAPPALAAELAETKRLATQAMGELLVIARQLRPTVLDDHGLVAALRTHVSDFSEQTGLRAAFATRGAVPRLTPEQQLAIYRVTQESLSNSAQHARASAVDVELSFVGRTTLTISDDGQGFVRKAAGSPPTLGLTGMRERALLAGGRLAISSEDGNGTRVELTI